MMLVMKYLQAGRQAFISPLVSGSVVYDAASERNFRLQVSSCKLTSSDSEAETQELHLLVFSGQISICVQKRSDIHTSIH